MTTGPVGVGIIGAGMISDFYLENPDAVSRPAIGNTGAPIPSLPGEFDPFEATP